MSPDTPSADRAPQTSTPALFPKIADIAARRPSRAVVRRMVAVAGPGVRVTTTAMTRNSVTDRMRRSYLLGNHLAMKLQRRRNGFSA